MCRKHGWQSESCPECMYSVSYDKIAMERAFKVAIWIIDATRAQEHILCLIARERGYEAALTLAREWQNPMPLPKVTCEF